MGRHDLVLVHFVHLTDGLLVPLDRVGPLLGGVSEGGDRVAEGGPFCFALSGKGGTRMPVQRSGMCSLA